MKALIIIAVIIFAVCRISIGVRVSYLQSGLMVALKLCGISKQIIPKSKESGEKPKKEKAKKEKSEKEEPDKTKPKKEKKSKGGMPLDLNFDEIVQILKKLFKGIGKFTRIDVNEFVLHIVLSGDDPYNTAVLFGKLNAALSTLAPLCSRNMKIRSSDVTTDIDFISGRTSVEAVVDISLTLGKIFSAVNTILFGVLGIFIKNRFRVAKEKIHKKLHPDPIEIEVGNAENKPDINETEGDNENGNG